MLMYYAYARRHALPFLIQNCNCNMVARREKTYRYRYREPMDHLSPPRPQYIFCVSKTVSLPLPLLYYSPHILHISTAHCDIHYTYIFLQIFVRSLLKFKITVKFVIINFSHLKCDFLATLNEDLPYSCACECVLCALNS